MVTCDVHLKSGKKIEKIIGSPRSILDAVESRMDAIIKAINDREPDEPSYYIEFWRHMGTFHKEQKAKVLIHCGQVEAIESNSWQVIT